MRIAHLDTGRAWRGGQRQVLLLLEGLRRRGHDVVLLAPEGPLLDAARAAGIEAAALRVLGEFDLGSGARAAARLAPWRPSLLHAHSAHAHTVAVRAASRLGCPVVVSRRVLAAVGRHPWSRRKYARGVARYLCISRAVVESMRASGVDASTLALVPSGVDLDALAAIRERVARGGLGLTLRGLAGAADEPIVGTAAALSDEKEPGRFVALAAATAAAGRRARWVWIGDGPRRASLVRESGTDGVRFVGFRSDAHELMAQLDLFVSCSRTEGLGTAVLEAQALGVPVVARDSGGVRDAIEDGSNGRVVGAPELESAVIDALDHPERRREWARAALVSVAEFGVEAMVDRTLSEYARVLAAPR